MKKYLLIFIIAHLSLFGFSQKGTLEAGLDLNFWQSSNGGNINVSPRVNYEVADSLVVGASFRYINYWSYLYGTGGHLNIFGIGIYSHYRFLKWLYAGADFELYFTPFNYNSTGANPKSRATAPAVLLNAGISHKFGKIFRLNAGIYFDAINSLNSPLRTSYMTKTNKGVYIPLFYRVTFLFDIPYKKSE